MERSLKDRRMVAVERQRRAHKFVSCTIIRRLVVKLSVRRNGLICVSFVWVRTCPSNVHSTQGGHHPSVRCRDKSETRLRPSRIQWRALCNWRESRRVLGGLFSGLEQLPTLRDTNLSVFLDSRNHFPRGTGKCTAKNPEIHFPLPRQQCLKAVQRNSRARLFQHLGGTLACVSHGGDRVRRCCSSSPRPQCSFSVNVLADFPTLGTCVCWLRHDVGQNFGKRKSPSGAISRFESRTVCVCS